MKALKLIVIGIVLFFVSSVQAQVAVSVTIGSPPPWGPAGYAEVRYYYLPDVEAYYDVQSSLFIYFEGGAWVHRAYLPTRYKSYDLYDGYKVVMTDYHGNTPYTNFSEHRTKYARGYHGKAQRTIGEKPGKGNDNNMKKDHGNDKKKDHGHGGGNDKKK